MVIIDDRDGSRDLASIYPLEERAILGHLEAADVMLTGHGPNASTITIGVEVKSVSDLLTSISTGRLGGHQIPKMIPAYNYTWLLVYGEVRPSTDNYLMIYKSKSYKRRKPGWVRYRVGGRDVPWSYLEGWLITAQLFSGIRIKWVLDLGTAARWLCILDRWLEKPWERHRGLSVFDRSGEPGLMPGVGAVESQIARTAASLPAINWVRGHAAARRFESVSDMMNADPADWEQIDGIGKIIAREVVSTIRRKK